MTVGKRGAAVGVLLGGTVVGLGSLVTWDICPNSSCGSGGGLMSLVDRSGIDIGWGVVTFGLGSILAVIGFDAFRRGGSSPAWLLALTLAAAILVVVALFLARTYLFADFLRYGPGEGVYLVGLGAVTTIVPSMRLRPSRHPPE